jgi:uncharacterized membrane protein YedE/YeeE
MSSYLPWWAGALALGSIAVAHARLTGRPMGVSGSLAKVAHAKDELAADEAAETMLRDEAALEAALLAATAAEFGEQDNHGSVHPRAPSAGAEARVPDGAPLAGHIAFLVMMAVGAAIAAVLRGGISLHTTLGPAHERLFGHGALALGALAIGGLLVGAGTRMSGGCTSGHGLSGCARLVPSSLLATCTFMAAAIGTSFLLAAVHP